MAAENSISFVLDGRIVTLGFDDGSPYSPTTTVLEFLRTLPNRTGAKEGCAEGDCGACTVVLGERTIDGTIRYQAVDSCLMFLPMLHGKQLITVENLVSPSGEFHPVQRSMVELYGSQCGFCTPGIVMSMFALYKNSSRPSRDDIAAALTGNLCRCTGYQPIVNAAEQACQGEGMDHFSDDEASTATLLRSIPSTILALKHGAQRYFRLATLPEALSLLAGHPDGTIIGGATDVALRVTKMHEKLGCIIDVSGIEILRSHRQDKDGLRLAGALTINEILPLIKSGYPALHRMLTVFASQQIRNVATLAGNLGTASPVGDTMPVLMACKANVVLVSARGERKIPIDEYIVDYRKTAKRSDELILAIELPKIPSGAIIQSYKISKRRDVDISTVSAGFRIGLDANNSVIDAVLAYGGMAERPRRATSTEKFLIGKSWTRISVEQAMELIAQDFTPISDVRGSAEFRLVAARNLLLKFWSETEGMERGSE